MALDNHASGHGWRPCVGKSRLDAAVARALAAQPVRGSRICRRCHRHVQAATKTSAVSRPVSHIGTKTDWRPLLPCITDRH